jgi:Zn-dependent M28 family amino/carboxypeptidase
MIYRSLLSVASVICFSLLISCSGNKNNSDNTDSTKVVSNVNIPDFNADSAYSYVDKQVAFGSRVPNTAAHEKCAEYLVSKLESYSKNVIVQSTKVKAFNGKVLNIKNIIASYSPETSNRIFICAHWDSRPFADQDEDEENYNKPIPGANDGASGVGVIIELARLFSKNPPPIGIDLILFDAEDYGDSETEDSYCLGSQYWSKNPHVKEYYAKYGILLDMVGAKDATFTMEEVSMKYAPDIMRKVWDIAVRAGYSDFFLYSKTSGVTDDHLYINELANIPTIDIIHRDSSTPTGFYKFWHTMDDDMAGIDKNTLKAVGQTLLTVIFEEQPLASK